jgi:hypothetical protein
MGWVGFRFRLRTLMIVVAIVAGVLGLHLVRRRWLEDRAEAARQAVLEAQNLELAHGEEVRSARRVRWAQEDLEKAESTSGPEHEWLVEQSIRWARLAAQCGKDAKAYRAQAARHAKLKRYYELRW